MSADLYTLTIPENMSVQDLLRAMSDLVAERDQLRADLAAAVARAEQAEARLAAIEAQPDVAICYHGKEQGWARLIGDTWPTGALIARPAKGAP